MTKEPQPNIAIDGDDARLILQALSAKGLNYPGPLLPRVVDLYNRLFALHINQPPRAANTLESSTQ